LKDRNLLRQWKVDIICLQETKLELNWCYLPSSGVSGSILLMSNRRVGEKIEVCMGEYVVACSFRNVEDDST
jgi:hypothetical protein